MRPLDAVHAVERRLEEAGVPSPRVDAEHLVAHVVGMSRARLYAADDELSEAQTRELASLVERRRNREPLAYVLGEWGFRRLVLKVDRRALVPRPETEVVVARCLELLRPLPAPRVLDVGVGSGAIALALADEHPGARVVGVERSPGALALARENLLRVPVDGRVELVEGDVLGGVAGPFDLVVSNPPYVEPDEVDDLEPEVRLYEPRAALVARGVTEAVAARARGVLRPGGWLVLECADGRAQRVATLLAELGYAEVATTRDLAGRERVVEACRP